MSRARGRPKNLPDQPIPDGFAIVLQALPGNNGIVYIGNSKANAEDHTVAFELGEGIFLRLYITNANLVWVDAATMGEGISWAVET